MAVAVLAMAVVAFAPGGEPEAKAALGPLQAVTLTAADFHPRSDSETFSFDGYAVTGDAGMVARIPFPAEAVVLTSVKVRVFDNVAGVNGAVCVTLYRAVPSGGLYGLDFLGQACTSGTSSVDPQTLTIPAVFTRIGGYHTAYIWVDLIQADPELRFYGATVFYRVVT
jgi:hypothetical protein